MKTSILFVLTIFSVNQVCHANPFESKIREGEQQSIDGLSDDLNTAIQTYEDGLVDIKEKTLSKATLNAQIVDETKQSSALAAQIKKLQKDIDDHLQGNDDFISKKKELETKKTALDKAITTDTTQLNALPNSSFSADKLLADLNKSLDDIKKKAQDLKDTKSIHKVRKFQEKLNQITQSSLDKEAEKDFESNHSNDEIRSYKKYLSTNTPTPNAPSTASLTNTGTPLNSDADATTFQTKCASYGGVVSDNVNGKSTCKIDEVVLGHDALSTLLPNYDIKNLANIKTSPLLKAYLSRPAGASCSSDQDFNDACADLQKQMNETLQYDSNTQFCVHSEDPKNLDQATPILSAEAYCEGPVVKGETTQLAEKLGFTPPSPNGAKPATPKAPDTTNCDQAKQEVAKEILKNNSSAFAQMNQLSALKMAYRLATAKPTKQTIEAFVKKYLHDHPVSDDQKKTFTDLYSKYGLSSDVDTLFSKLSANQFNYHDQKLRMDNATASSLILFLMNHEDNSIPSDLQFEVSDAAAVWAQNKIINVKNFKATGDGEKNLMSLSTQVCRLMKDPSCSDSKNTIGLTVDEIKTQVIAIENKLEPMIQAAAKTALSDQTKAACFFNEDNKTPCDSSSPKIGSASISDLKLEMAKLVGKDDSSLTIDPDKTQIKNDNTIDLYFK